MWAPSPLPSPNVFGSSRPDFVPSSPFPFPLPPTRGPELPPPLANMEFAGRFAAVAVAEGAGVADGAAVGPVLGNDVPEAEEEDGPPPREVPPKDEGPAAAFAAEMPPGRAASGISAVRLARARPVR